MRLPHKSYLILQFIKGMTLLELLIAISLLSLIILALASINTFSHYHVLTAQYRSKVQNEASLILEHMTKQIGNAIGNEAVNGAKTVVNTDWISGHPAIRVFVDAGTLSGGLFQPGEGQGSNVTPTGNDHWIAYTYAGSGTYAHQLRYCNYCQDEDCIFSQCRQTPEVLTNRMTSFIPAYPANQNFVNIQFTTCWNTVGANLTACGSADNPDVTMNTDIKMPSVSTN